MQELIKLVDVTKVFKRADVHTHAVSEVSLSIHENEYASISGPSGSGKSTLLSILGLLDSPTSGQYILNGQDVSRLNSFRKAAVRNKEIGFIFQSFNLISELTVFENVALPLSYRKDISKADRKKKAQQVLERVEMDHRQDYFPWQLSGGQQQRVAVARALGGDPAILLADEPTGNLDSKNAESVLTLLDSLHQEGSTICLVTHDPRSADRAKRHIELIDGKLANAIVKSDS